MHAINVIKPHNKLWGRLANSFKLKDRKMPSSSTTSGLVVPTKLTKGKTLQDHSFKTVKRITTSEINLAFTKG